MKTTDKNYQKFIPAFGIDETVDLEFYASGRIKNCEVQAFKITKHTIKYDIRIMVTPASNESERKDPKRWTVIKNVDSVCVVAPE